MITASTSRRASTSAASVRPGTSLSCIACCRASSTGSATTTTFASGICCTLFASSLPIGPHPISPNRSAILRAPPAVAVVPGLQPQDQSSSAPPPCQSPSVAQAFQLAAAPKAPRSASSARSAVKAVAVVPGLHSRDQSSSAPPPCSSPSVAQAFQLAAAAQPPTSASSATSAVP